MVTYEAADDGAVEEFADMEELEEELASSATAEYAETVLAGLREKGIVSIANGGSTDVYEMVDAYE